MAKAQKSRSLHVSKLAASTEVKSWVEEEAVFWISFKLIHNLLFYRHENEEALLKEQIDIVKEQIVGIIKEIILRYQASVRFTSVSGNVNDGTHVSSLSTIEVTRPVAPPDDSLMHFIHVPLLPHLTYTRGTNREQLLTDQLAIIEKAVIKEVDTIFKKYPRSVTFRSVRQNRILRWLASLKSKGSSTTPAPVSNDNQPASVNNEVEVVSSRRLENHEVTERC